MHAAEHDNCLLVGTADQQPADNRTGHWLLPCLRSVARPHPVSLMAFDFSERVVAPRQVLQPEFRSFEGQCVSYIALSFIAGEAHQ